MVIYHTANLARDIIIAAVQGKAVDQFLTISKPEHLVDWAWRVAEAHQKRFIEHAKEFEQRLKEGQV